MSTKVKERPKAKRTRRAEMTVSEPVRCGWPTTVSGKGWKPSHSVSIVLDGVRRRRVFADDRGRFSTEVTLHERGQHRIDVSQVKTARSLVVQAGV